MGDLKITLKKSLIGHKKDRIATALSLGLKKINSYTMQPNNGSTQGKISKISDLICVESLEKGIKKDKKAN